MGLDNFYELLKDVKEMDDDELTSLVQAISDRRDILRDGRLRDFKIGDIVSWKHGQGQNRENYEGQVIKINSKTIAVKEKGRSWSRWRISPSILTKIEGDES